MHVLLVLTVLFKKLIMACLLPLGVPVVVFVKTILQLLCGYSALISVISLTLLFRDTFLLGFDLMFQTLFHILDLIISFLCDFSHHEALFIVKLTKFLLLLALMLNLLIFKLVGDLFEALGGKLIRSREVTLVLLATRFSIVVANYHLLKSTS